MGLLPAIPSQVVIIQILTRAYVLACWIEPHRLILPDGIDPRRWEKEWGRKEKNKGQNNQQQVFAGGHPPNY
jgi:hypothetical protein